MQWLRTYGADKYNPRGLGGNLTHLSTQLLTGLCLDCYFFIILSIDLLRLYYYYDDRPRNKSIKNDYFITSCARSSETPIKSGNLNAAASDHPCIFYYLCFPPPPLTPTPTSSILHYLSQRILVKFKMAELGGINCKFEKFSTLLWDAAEGCFKPHPPLLPFRPPTATNSKLPLI